MVIKCGFVRNAIISLAAAVFLLAPAAPALADTSGPTTPNNLRNGYQGSTQACSTDPNSPLYLNGGGGIMLEGESTSTVTSILSEQFQIWPLNDPAEVQPYGPLSAGSGTEGMLRLQSSSLSDGQEYAWDVQASDSSGTSAWSATCYFTVDDTAPPAPTVTSPNYPQGADDQGGAPIQVEFGANGGSDVTGYLFSWVGYPAGNCSVPSSGVYTSGSGCVPASTLGGSATALLIPPDGSFYRILTVASLDRAGNMSATTTYDFYVKQDAPTVVEQTGNAGFGDTAHFHVTADPGLEAVSPVTSYTVTYATAEPYLQTFTVKASAGGNADFGLPLDNQYGIDFLAVQSTSANGWTSQANYLNITTAPMVTSNVYPEDDSGGGAGVPGTFTVTPPVKNPASYTYTINWGNPVAVKADGNSPFKINWTPDSSGFYDLEVTVTTADGVQLPAYDYFFMVN